MVEHFPKILASEEKPPPYEFCITGAFVTFVGVLPTRAALPSQNWRQQRKVG